jgi:hypothetical protein
MLQTLGEELQEVSARHRANPQKTVAGIRSARVGISFSNVCKLIVDGRMPIRH